MPVNPALVALSLSDLLTLDGELPEFLLLIFGALCFDADGLVIGPLTSTDLGVAAPRTFLPADIVTLNSGETCGRGTHLG